MTIFTSPRPLVWGELDVPMLGLAKDWHGTPLEPPATFSLAMDARRLWFIAHHRHPANLHPKSQPGRFQAGLWQHDVAELFIADPLRGRYFEFNLAPNGAWWSCEFSATRIRDEPTDIVMPDVVTFSELAPDGGWVAAMAIPLDLLRARLDFGTHSRINVAMILNSPDQRFITAAVLGGSTPDFHQPQQFSKIVLAPFPE